MAKVPAKSSKCVVAKTFVRLYRNAGGEAGCAYRFLLKRNKLSARFLYTMVLAIDTYGMERYMRERLELDDGEIEDVSQFLRGLAYVIKMHAHVRFKDLIPRERREPLAKRIAT